MLAAFLAAAVRASAQPAEAPRQFEITSVSFEGNSALSRSDLLAQVVTRETPGFLSKFLRNTISENLSRKNEYLNLMTVGSDMKRLRSDYEDHGFWEVSIDTSLAYNVGAGTVGITFRINEGHRFLLDSLTYQGIVNAPGQIMVEIQSSPKIARGDPYDRQLLDDEVVRVLRILANYGYPNALFVRDRSWAQRYASSKSFRVQLSFDLGKMYFFDGVTIRREVDSLRSAVPREDITDDILLQQLTFSPGQHFSREDSVTSASNLNRLGVFDLRKMDMKVPQRQDTAVTVPTSILYRPRDRYELGPELIVSDENGSLNLGTGLGYTHRNFMGGARLFTTRLRFRTQTLNQFPNYFGTNTDAVSNLDLTFELVQPYIFSNLIKGSWSFSYIVDKEEPYLQNIIRNKFGFTEKLAEFTNGFLDWTLEAIDSKKNAYFNSNTSDIEVQQLISLLQKPQFNSILSFTIQRDVTNDLFSPSAGSITSAEFDEAGLFPLLLQGMFPHLPIAQFYRVSLFGRWYTEASPHRFSVLAYKLKGGFESRYGESRSDTNVGIPQTQRFYAGGGNSLRGWISRGLIASAGSPELGGNLAFEASVELRTNVFQSLRDGVLDKFWLVQFIDAGNVWGEVRDFRLNTFAISAGLGLRYDTFFGPFRVDWGFRIYNPAERSGQQWITQRKLFGQTLKEGIFHFGIGQAF